MVIISCARDAMIRMVVFDVGETLVDETRQWSEWAEWLHVPKFTFFAAFGAVIASGSHHREVFRLVANLDFRQAIEKRIESGWRYEIRATDFYPDALPCLEKLRAEGRKLGVVGNQPKACEECLRRLGLELDLLGSSEGWGIEKPSRRFFERLAMEARLAPEEICYVGDHPENDIRPARSVGLRTVFIRRGPWALAQSDSAAARDADRQIGALTDLPAALALL
jgi:HAD superfamily hydrolase (TIGR01549 family)